jgi:hypothetical protein
MVSTTLRAWHEMVDMPARHGGDRLVAYWALSMLILPKGLNPSFPLQGVFHLSTEALCEIHAPLGGIGVCVTFDFYMPSDGHTGSFGEMDGVHHAIFVSSLSREHPFP